MNFNDVFPLNDSALLFQNLSLNLDNYTVNDLGYMLYNKCASRELAPIIEELVSDYDTTEERAKVVGDYLKVILTPLWERVKPTFETDYNPLAIKSRETVTDKQSNINEDNRTSTKNENVYGFDTEEAVPSETSSNTDTGKTNQNKDRTYTMDTEFDREEIPSKLLMADREFRSKQFVDFVIDSISREMVLSVY